MIDYGEKNMAIVDLLGQVVLSVMEFLKQEDQLQNIRNLGMVLGLWVHIGKTLFKDQAEWRPRLIALAGKLGVSFDTVYDIDSIVKDIKDNKDEEWQRAEEELEKVGAEANRDMAKARKTRWGWKSTVS